MPTLSDLTHSLERTWSAIRTINPDTPPAVIVVYAHQAGDRRGHYWAESWRQTGTETRVDEVHISSTILQEGAESVLETLLHESAHGIARTRNIQDTSRQGRYHNHHFCQLAAEVGLETDTAPGTGCVTPGILPHTRQTYKNILAEVQEALTLWQDNNSRNRRRTGRTTYIKLTCPDCARIIRASQQTIDGGPIECTPCGQPFQTA